MASCHEACVQFPFLSDQRLCDPVGCRYIIVGIASLDAKMTLADRSLQSRADRDDGAIAYSDVHLAAGAAVGASCLGPSGGCAE